MEGKLISGATTRCWIFTGKPEYIDSHVAPATALEGGYLVVLALTDGSVRLAATRYPARYLNTWQGNARRFGIADVDLVLVSSPLLRYEAVKRSLARQLANYQVDGKEGFWIGLNALNEAAQRLFDEAGLSR